METPHTPSPAQAVERIILIGPTGAGKTTTGQALATLLGWRFLDLDSAIEQATGMPVRDIFAREGEAGFRAREAEALAGALTRSRVVIATGAGIVEPEAAPAMVAAAPDAPTTPGFAAPADGPDTSSAAQG